MMDIHDKIVAELEGRHEKLSPEERVLLLQKVILAVELRASVTLSQVTMLVVLDRVLRQSLEKFPVLSSVTSSNLINFKNLDTHKNPEELSTALRFLLLELLRVIGRITADILTTPLHQELIKVTLSDQEKK